MEQLVNEIKSDIISLASKVSSLLIQCAVDQGDNGENLKQLSLALGQLQEFRNDWRLKLQIKYSIPVSFASDHEKQVFSTQQSISQLQLQVPSGITLQSSGVKIDSISLVPNNLLLNAKLQKLDLRKLQFSQYFRQIGGYLDSSRLKLSAHLVRKLTQLVQRELDGQMNCFLVLGTRGIGKSQFLLELGKWTALIGDSNHAFIYFIINEHSHSWNLRRVIHAAAVQLGWLQASDNVWPTIRQCYQWMIENGKTMLVVLDEFDNAFRSARFDWTSEVTSVAGYTTFRPLVVILSGSAARLLPLAVKKLSNSDAAAQGYFMQEHTFDMNSTKYVPKTLSPICSLPEFKLALKAVRGSEADGLYDDQIWRLCFETRGCVRCMKKCKLPAADQLDSDQFRSVFPFKTAFNSLFGPYKKVIEHLLRTVQELLLVHELQLENVNNVGNLLYEMADNGLINFDGDVEFGFAFPADILTCLHLFYEQSPEDGIGIIEKISLYFPQNAGTLDVNENLVFDSFCSIEQFTGGWSLLLLAFKLKS